MCYGTLAAHRKDVDLCKEGFFKGTMLLNNDRAQALCIFGYVENTGETFRCREMPLGTDIFVGNLFDECEDLVE